MVLRFPFIKVRHKLTSTVGFPRESMMNLPLTPVIADMLRASTGRAARAAALVMEESMPGQRVGSSFTEAAATDRELRVCLCDYESASRRK